MARASRMRWGCCSCNGLLYFQLMPKLKPQIVMQCLHALDARVARMPGSGNALCEAFLGNPAGMLAARCVKVELVCGLHADGPFACQEGGRVTASVRAAACSSAAEAAGR